MSHPRKVQLQRLCLHLLRKVISQIKLAKFTKSKRKYAILEHLQSVIVREAQHLFPLTIHESELGLI